MSSIDINHLLNDFGRELEELVRKGDILGVASLLAKRRSGEIKLNFDAALDSTGNTIVHQAIRRLRDGDGPDILELLLEAGADPDKKNRTGYSPLHWCINMASVSGRAIEYFHVLMKHGALVDPVNEFNETPLHSACHHGHVDMVRALLDHGAGIMMRRGRGFTQLHQVGNASIPEDVQVEVATVLLDRGADIDAPNDEGVTPVAFACRSGSGKLTGYLLSRGAVLDEPDAKKLLSEVLSRTGKKSKDAEAALVLMRHLGLDIQQKYDGKTLLSRFSDLAAKDLIREAIRRCRSVELSDRLNDAMSQDSGPSSSSSAAGMSL